MSSDFDAIYGATVRPVLLDLFADRRRWRYFASLDRSEPVSVSLYAAPIETRIEETVDRERKVRERVLVMARDPDDPDHPGLAEVHKQGVFEDPDGQRWSVLDDETDTRSPSLLRVRVQYATHRKLDAYAAR